MTYSADQLIAKYIELRDKKAELAEEFKLRNQPFNEGMEIIENALMDMLNAQGGQNIKTGSGTAYISEVLNVKVEDWESFSYWVQRFGTPDFFVKNANKTAVKEYMDGGGPLPPGLSMSTLRNLNVRRS